MLRRALALLRLRLRVFRGYLIFQLIVDLGLPVTYALLAARALPAEDVVRLPAAAFVMGATLSVLRLPAMLMMIERRFGMANLLRASGAGAGEHSVASAVSLAYFGLFPAAAYLMTCAALGLSPAAPPTTWAGFGLYLLVAHGAALVLARRFPSPGGLGLGLNLAVATVATLCPLYYSAERVPDVLWPAVAWLPATLSAGAAGGADDALSDLAALAAWAAAALSLGYGAPPWSQPDQK